MNQFSNFIVINLKKTLKNPIYLLLIISLATSCNLDQTPKCGDPEVVGKAIKLLNEKIKEQVKTEYFNKNFNEYDAIEYAKNKGWNSSEYVKQEKKRLSIESNNYADSILKTTSFKNIRINNINKEIKLCSCSAQVVNLHLTNIDVDYTAQQTEDKEKSIFVELSYKVNSSNEKDTL